MMNPDEGIIELMRIAYHAGFNASGEGEYPDKDLTEALNKRFDSMIQLLENQK